MSKDLPWEWFEVGGIPNKYSTVAVEAYGKNGKYYVIPESEARELWAVKDALSFRSALHFKEIIAFSDYNGKLYLENESLKKRIEELEDSQ